MNSLAIESQLANLDFTAKTALYLNDDFFLTRVGPESLDEHVHREINIALCRNSPSPTSLRLSTVRSFDFSEISSSLVSLRKTLMTVPTASGRGLGIAHGYLVRHIAIRSSSSRYSGLTWSLRADKRFGARGRPYLLHIAKVIPVPLLKEIQQVFISDLTTVCPSVAAPFTGHAR